MKTTEFFIFVFFVFFSLFLLLLFLLLLLLLLLMLLLLMLLLLFLRYQMIYKGCTLKNHIDFSSLQYFCDDSEALFVGACGKSGAPTSRFRVPLISYDQ